MENKSKAAQFKSWIIDLFKDENKSYDTTDAEGKKITISDNDGDGSPSVGDTVSGEDGTPMKSTSIAMGDGSTIKTDDEGKITSIEPKAEDKPAEAAADASAKSVEVQLTELKALYDAEVKDHNETKEIAQKTITELNNRLKEIKSTYEPKVSATQFPDKSGKNQKQAMSKEERKAALLAEEKK